MSDQHDQTMTTLIGKLAAAVPAKAVPWDVVISAFLSVLKACGIVPASAGEAKQMLANLGPFQHLRVKRKLIQSGFKAADAEASIGAAKKVAGESTDAEVQEFLDMAAAVDVAD